MSTIDIREDNFDLNDVLFQGEFWVTKEGEKLRIGAMQTTHLVNSINHLRRCANSIHANHLAVATAASFSLRGDAATYYADRELESMVSSSPEDYIESLPVVEAMREELARRGHKEGTHEHDD